MAKTPTTTMTPKLTIERVFGATPDRLWTYWTDPTKYAKWLNPSPGDLIVQEFDVRVGGRVKFLMPLPDGRQMPNEGVFHKLDPPHEIVTGDADKSFLIEVRFAPEGKRTRMRIVVSGLPGNIHEQANAGWNAGLDKLAGLLASSPKPGRA